MALQERLTTKVGKVYDKVWRKLEGDSQYTISLLKPSTSANEFETVAELEGKWFFEYSDYRKQFILEIASLDETLEENIGEATHLDMGPDGIFVIVKADVTPPVGTDVTWKIACEKFTKRGQFQSLY